MSYFAAALARGPQGWVGAELDLDGVEDLDTVADMVRDVAGDSPAGPALLFVEENDEWFAILRVDDDVEPRVFISDPRAVETSHIAGVFYDEVLAAPPVEVAEGGDAAEDDAEESETMKPAAEPAGDLDVLADLGTPAEQLTALCGEEGQLPADIISAVCERAGCLDELERLREG